MAKILIIEDDRILAKACDDMLKKAGMETLTANDGEAGLQMALADKPDAILLDILLPKRDGVSVLEELKKDPKCKDIPVVVLTNIGHDDPIAKEVKSFHPATYIVKVDSNPETITKAIFMALKK